MKEKIGNDNNFSVIVIAAGTWCVCVGLGEQWPTVFVVGGERKQGLWGKNTERGLKSTR